MALKNLSNPEDNLNTIAQWYIRKMASFVSPLYKVTHNDINGDILKSEEELYHFFCNMYNDMYKNPQMYNISQDPFKIDEKFNKKRLKVRKIVTNCVIDFIYKLGILGRVEMNKLIIESKTWNDLIIEKSKKVKSEKVFANILDRLGFMISVNKAHISIDHSIYPNMFTALNYFAKICSSDKKKGLRYFYQLDFRYVNSHKLEVSDAIRLLPSLLKDEVIETDLLLKKLKYRLKVEIYEDHGYRLIYSNKAGVVYYILINSYQTENYYHYLRWVLNTAQTETLFKELEQDSLSDITDYLLGNLIECDPNCIPGYGASSPESCKARIKIPIKNRIFYTCKDKGCSIGTENLDFKYTRLILKYIQSVIYK